MTEEDMATVRRKACDATVKAIEEFIGTHDSSVSEVSHGVDEGQGEIWFLYRCSCDGCAGRFSLVTLSLSQAADMADKGLLTRMTLVPTKIRVSKALRDAIALTEGN